MKEKYAKLEEEYLKSKERATKLREKGKAFHEAVEIAKLLTEQLDKAKADNLNLEKGNHFKGFSSSIINSNVEIRCIYNCLLKCDLMECLNS